MPWQEVSVMDQKLEFVHLARLPGANVRELCRRFGISPPTAYKWLRRWEEAGKDGLAEHSRRPGSSPRRTSDAVEVRVLAVRDAHPTWGARKIARCLEWDGVAPPAVSTVHAILARHGRIPPEAGRRGGKPWQRFEMEQPNQIWQMDFKGWVPLVDGRPCHPLTMIDDHSRYALCVRACADQKTATVQGCLEAAFRRYGLPDRLFVDNGVPWSDSGGQRLTRLAVWLMKLGVDVIRSRPYHPQSRGKNERLHGTLKTDVFSARRFREFAEVQAALDAWRHVYNHHRPHEALGQERPSSRYRPSRRSMPEQTPAVEYDEGDILRRVGTTKDYISFRGRLWKVPMALAGETVAIRPTDRDGELGIFFGSNRVGTIDLTQPKPVNHVSEQASTMSLG